jgi:DinB superfamily
MPLNAQEREVLIAKYAAGPGRLREAISAVPAAARQFRPAPGKWSAHEIVVHCADAETNAAARIRYLIAEKDPVVQGYDEAEWARALDYHAHSIDVALATVEAVRAHTVELVRRLPESAWGRVGRHTESGSYSAEKWLQLYADHVHSHADQVDRAHAAWKAKG